MQTPSLSNILFVVLEDFSTLASQSFAPGSDSLRHTPHLQRLAARGVTFDKVYCQAPICNPSRTSFLTSRRPSSTHVYSNDDLTFPSLPTIVDFVKSAAPGAVVACGGGGKIFHIACDKEERGFINGAAQLRNDNAMNAAADVKIVRALNRTHGGYAALRATMYGNPPTGRTNDQDKTRVSLRLLAHYTRTRERFFLAVGLSSTHVQAGRICMNGAVLAESGVPVPVGYVLCTDLLHPTSHFLLRTSCFSIPTTASLAVMSSLQAGRSSTTRRC